LILAAVKKFNAVAANKPAWYLTGSQYVEWLLCIHLFIHESSNKIIKEFFQELKRIREI
jgi:hypothetical protein